MHLSRHQKGRAETGGAAGLSDGRPILSASADVIASRKRLSGFYLRPAVFAVEMVGTEFSDQYAREDYFGRLAPKRPTRHVRKMSALWR
jgi:hypothetical protein